MEVARQLRQPCHFNNITIWFEISDWFEMLLVSNSIIFMPYFYIQSQPCLDYLPSILKIFTYQTSFREDLDKSALSVHT